MGGKLNHDAATSRHGTGYSVSTKSHFQKVDNQFQDFVQRTGGLLIQSEAHTRKDLMGGVSLDDIKSATLDHIITWNFPNDDTAEMPTPKSTVYWLGTCANDHAMISCTIDEQLLSYKTLGRETQEAEQERSRRKKMIPSKYRAFNQNSTQSCAQLFNKSSLILTRESVLKRWVSGVWLKVELRQQGCSCTRMH